MKLIVGLGNPGKKYQKTRHNVGFMFVDKIVESYNEKFKLDKARLAEIAEVNINGEKVIFMKPQTYMNLSGSAVSLVKAFYKIDIEDILIVYDDLDLDLARIKIKPSGSSGGHNGIKSLISSLGTQDIKRVRVGISKGNTDTIDYVLGNFNKVEKKEIDMVIELAPSIAIDFVELSFDALMNKYN
jgi:PTH1 family peptidyl-tRNA hydrolase